MVTHVMSGISAATYYSNKTSNDAMFKQTVVSMMGYDSQMDAISIQLVTDVAVSRYLVATTSAEIELVYSIGTPTSIFNDTNHATARFIQALNESIITNAFDTLLRAASNDWVSVTTDYVIFSTASPTSTPTSSPTSSPTSTPTSSPTSTPTSSPTSTPTSSPTSSPTSTPTSTPTSSPTSTPTSSPTSTEGNIVATSILDIPLDDKVAKAKIQYYLGAFVGYFLSIYFCLYLYSLLRYGNNTATKLYDTSYQSEANISNSAISADNSNSSILADIYAKNAVLKSAVMLEEELNAVKAVATTSRHTTVPVADDITSMYSISISSKLDRIFITEDQGKYSKAYREYVQQQRTLLGCASFLYPDGCILKIPCTSMEICLPPGRVENMLLYVCHNHPLFSCFYFMEGSKLGAHGTRILYIGKDVVVFVLYQFSNMLLQYLMLDGIGLGTLINLFVITPSAVSVGLLLKYLYTCPFTETVEFQRKYAKCQSTVLFLGRLAIIPIMVIMLGSLVIACLFSSGRHIPLIIVNYFLYVQLYGVLLAIAKTMLLFIDNYYYRLLLFGALDLLCVGQLYKERVIVEQLVVDVDYAYRIDNYLFGLIQVQMILNRDDAIKAKWITEGGEGEKAYDIEMKGIVGRDDDAFAVQINPLQRELNIRSSAVFRMDSILGDGKNDEDVGGEYDVYNSTTKTHDTLMPVENPIHSLAPAEAIDKRCVSTNSKPSKLVEGHSVVAEDDAALYLEYQTLRSTHHNDAVYDMGADDSEVVMSFEEWKTRRKQFKQGADYSLILTLHTYLLTRLLICTHSVAGTRGSLVKAFQMFEEREQLVMESIEQSASVRNTMKLHSNKAKNVLAAPQR